MTLRSHLAFLLLPVIALLAVPSVSAQVADPPTQEDFSSASLGTSHLVAASPELVETAEEPGYISEWVTLQWRPDDPIYLYVVRPTKIQKPPVVIYLYDYPAETDIFREDEWCQRVTAGGYAAVGFVPALNGHRFHGRPLKEWFVSELQESLAKSAHDMQMVLNYLAQRGDVDVSNVGMYGVGAGATISVLSASVDPRIKALDLVDPWGDWPSWMANSVVIPEEERANYLKADFQRKIAAFDPVALLPSMTAPHIRLVQFLKGSSTPQEAGLRMEKALPRGAEHQRLPDSAQFDPMMASAGQGFAWLKQQLKAPRSKGLGSKAMSARSSVDHHSGRHN